MKKTQKSALIIATKTLASLLFLSQLLLPCEAQIVNFSMMSSEQKYSFFADLHEKLKNDTQISELNKRIPKFTQNLASAKTVSKSFWSDSTIFDEIAKAQILEVKVIKALGIPFQKTDQTEHVSAGLMHTYGYLFSQLNTPYGKKGKRWLESALDERLGLSAMTFSPFAKEGEFLSNLTYTLSKLIPTLQKNSSLSQLNKVAPSIKKAFTKPAFAANRYVGSVRETVTYTDPQKKKHVLQIYTHLLKLDDKAEQKNEVLLVYEIEESKRHRLVTAFPIKEDFSGAIQKTAALKGTQFKPRFNLYVNPQWKVLEYANHGYTAAPSTTN